MQVSTVTGAGVAAAPLLESSHPETVGRERLLDIPEVCKITGFGEATASKVMKETGCCIRLHSRLYVLESSFYKYLHKLEVSEPCSM